MILSAKVNGVDTEFNVDYVLDKGYSGKLLFIECKYYPNVNKQLHYTITMLDEKYNVVTPDIVDDREVVKMGYNSNLIIMEKDGKYKIEKDRYGIDITTMKRIA